MTALIRYSCNFAQGSIPVGCVPPAFLVRMQNPLDADPPSLQADPPQMQTPPLWMQTPHRMQIPTEYRPLDADSPQMQTPTGCRPPFPWSCNLRCMLRIHPVPYEQTDRCKNITFPQLLFDTSNSFTRSLCESSPNISKWPISLKLLKF